MYLLSIWSLSNHFQNKVLPSILFNRKIKIISVLSNKDRKDFKLKNIFFYNNKKNFFLKNRFDYVYISSINSEHYNHCKFALESNKNVICEKPICLNIRQLSKLKTIAIKKKKKFFEVIQYVHHPLFARLKNIIKSNSIGKVLRVKSSFKIPLNDKKNFRFNKNLGGGSLNDVGFYPISIMFTLFNSKKIKLLKSKITRQNKVDMQGEIKAQNENKVIFDLSWGFDSSYKNNLTIYGTKGNLLVDFIFSKNINQDGKIIINVNRKLEVIKISKSNQINLAFKDMLSNKNKLFNKRYLTSYRILNMIEKLKKK
jgi:NDP-hexose-3-ketoreductase|tara:strand:+ start:1021 stop:1956 length:936 start_codon:yes stop_codon:yes gene_type:complete